MKIGILTSTRADFGIYLPLIKFLSSEKDFEVEIIAFGTHLSQKYGMTINEIYRQGFDVKHQIHTLPHNDTPEEIAKSIGETVTKFSDFWSSNSFDLVFTLGDRYEMFAAVTAASPFNIKIAHIHGGETTLGAIDNAYRHSISLMSKYVFVSTETYKKRAIEITEKPQNVFNVGALSVDNLKQVELYSISEMQQQFKIDLSKPTILSTFHPETINLEKNLEYINELLQAIDILRKKYQIVITMPNADTMGLSIREKIINFSKGRKNIIIIESFGMKGYLSCMKYSTFLLGNTSSGFVEAAFFPKWVINLGNRQDGRIITENIISIPVNKQAILKAVNEIENRKLPENCNIYGDGKTAERITQTVKNLLNEK